MYEIEFTPMARREFKKLTPKVQREIAKQIDDLGENPLPVDCKKIKGVSKKIQKKLEVDCIYRIRATNYRILYAVKEEKILICILKIEARKEVYDFLKKGL